MTKFKPPLEPLSKDGPDTLLSMACIRGHIGVIDYLVKVKGCDAFGECLLYPLGCTCECLIPMQCMFCLEPCIVMHACTYYSLCHTTPGPVNGAGDTLQSIADSLRLSEVITYLKHLSADSAGEH